MENTIEDLDRGEIVPTTQRDLDAIALFEELHKAEKERYYLNSFPNINS
ncbi:hypothetical protein M1146_05095 [Patescibacteria group bacterium]|nr:hypothetical protein [Patescibacteria group bacterium]